MIYDYISCSVYYEFIVTQMTLRLAEVYYCATEEIKPIDKSLIGPNMKVNDSSVVRCDSVNEKGTFSLINTVQNGNVTLYLYKAMIRVRQMSNGTVDIVQGCCGMTVGLMSRCDWFKEFFPEIEVDIWWNDWDSCRCIKFVREEV